MSFIYVYDDLIPEPLIKEIHGILDHKGFTRTEVDHPRQDRAKAMAVAELSPSDDFVQSIMNRVFNVVPNAENLYCYRVYANCYTPSDCPEPHVDLHERDGCTVLYYANSEWSWEHGGETVFFDKDKEIIKAVLPKPGRIVIFDPTIFHCARVQNSLAPKYRYTIAIKLKEWNGREHDL